MPPPPPPPGPPPPPAMGSGDFLQPGKKETESRSLLLSSIRQGTKLKKAVTNDRSAPAVDAGSSNKNNNNSSGDFSRTNGGPPGLAGLFAGGMPKLKSVGQRNIDQQNNVTPLLPPNKKSIAPSPPIAKSDRMNNPGLVTQVPQNTYPGTMKRPNDRGPAPQPPPMSNKPNFGANATLPRRFGPPLPNKPPVQANKPNVGPRPTTLAGSKPVPPLKAPSLPAHPPNLRRPASMGEHDYRNGQLAKGNLFTSSTSQLNGSINNQQRIGTVSPTQTNRIQLQQKQLAPLPPTPATLRMAAPPPPARTTGTMGRPPVNRPPPPPSKIPTNISPVLPPPPPPSMPPPVPTAPPSYNAMVPPPPPHRSASTKLLMPTPPPPAGQPPPPPRSSSCPPSRKASGDDFESKFYHKFRNIAELPPPEPYLNCSKTYRNSRRQPPPPPPIVLGSASLFAREESKC